MALWLLFALMTAMAMLAVLWPLARARGLPRSGNDVAVYRDQLEEIARDRAAGQIGEAEAEAARVEVSRRLIVAADAEAAACGPAPTIAWHRRVVAAMAFVVLPVGATALYLVIGSPELPGQPLAARYLDPGGLGLGLADLAGGTVARDLLKLIAIDRDVIARSRQAARTRKRP